MRVDFVKLFVDSTSGLLEEVLGERVEVSAVAMKAGPVTGRDVMVVIRLAGEAHGQVVFDMDAPTAVGMAGHLIGEESRGITPLVQSLIAELASMAIGRAISRINDRGARLKMTPPTVMAAADLDANDPPLETLVAPISTASGEVRMNVTVRDLG